MSKLDEILEEQTVQFYPERTKQEIKNLFLDVLPELLPDREERQRWYDMFPDQKHIVADIRNQVLVEVHRKINEL